MTHRRLVLVALAAALAIATPSGAAAVSPTIRLAIAHVAQHCHVWRTSTKTLGASTRITLKRGTRLVVRSDCPMDFDYAQTKGPKLALGNARTYAGATRVLRFARAGVYRFTATNVQTPEERGLITLGAPNVLTLTVVVK